MKNKIRASKCETFYFLIKKSLPWRINFVFKDATQSSLKFVTVFVYLEIIWVKYICIIQFIQYFDYELVYFHGSKKKLKISNLKHKKVFFQIIFSKLLL